MRRLHLAGRGSLVCYLKNSVSQHEIKIIQTLRATFSFLNYSFSSFLRANI